MINGDQYTIPIDLEKLNNYSSFNNYVLEYLSTQDSNISDSYIKYIYGEKIINSNNYSNFINTYINEITISIIFQNLQKKYSNNDAFYNINI